MFAAGAPLRFPIRTAPAAMFAATTEFAWSFGVEIALSVIWVVPIAPSATKPACSTSPHPGSSSCGTLEMSNSGSKRLRFRVKRKRSKVNLASVGSMRGPTRIHG
jgi:hypothetical protein